MERSEFQRILTLGLGRAVLDLRSRSGPLYRDVILDACLHNRAHDPQVESSRAEYMFDVIRESGEIAFFADAICESLSSAEENGWNTPQRFELARRLAQNGNASARKAMYAAFETRGFSVSEIAVEFVALDGIKGLLFVVGHAGAELAKDVEQFHVPYLLDVAHDLCGREPVDAALENAATTNAEVKAYLDAVRSNLAVKVAARKPEPKDLSYNQIRSLIEADQAGGVLVRWGQLASDSDLLAAAHDLVREHDPAKLRAYLHIFRKRCFPLDVSTLLKFAEQPDGPLPRHALSVLANLKDESIRGLAYKMIETRSSKRGYSIDLLVQNFRNGDHQMIEAWCGAEADPDIVNAFDRSLRGFFAAHPDREIEIRLLRSFYEKEPCSHCRCYIVERLGHLDSLTDEIRRECEYDSYAETRSVARSGEAQDRS